MTDARPMTDRRRGPTTATFFKLGRVSNLPTVWSNVLLGTVLGGGSFLTSNMALVLAAMTLFYVGGMYLNDWFDRKIDARQRANRPIPAGEISAGTVATLGFGMLAAGVCLMLATGIRAPLALFTAVALPAAIVLYDSWHKGNVFSPLLMGLCRALVVIGAASVVAGDALPALVWQAAVVLLLYVAGLTYAAKQEALDRIGNLWPLAMLAAPLLLAWPAIDQAAIGRTTLGAFIGWTIWCVWLLAKRPMPGAVPRAVVSLIAGISLVDAMILASVGAGFAALIALACFAATLGLQKLVAGT
jgi:4-hydroxybenzoate polyprenyltransferase